MKTALFRRLLPVRVATTPGEREAVFRLRYQVYVEELHKRDIPGADHAARMIKDPEDDRPDTRIYYTGSADAPTGTVRLELYRPGALPEELIKKFSLDEYPEFLEESISIVRYMITTRKARRRQIPARFTIEGFLWTCQEEGSRISLSTAPPAVALAYRKLGYRPYASTLYDTPDGVRIPVINIWSDHAYHRAQRSPVAGLIRKTFGPGRRPGIDMSRYRGRIADAASAFRVDPTVVHAEVGPLFLKPIAVFHGMDRNAATALARVGTVMDLGPGQVLYRKGLVDRELYIVLHGALDVIRDGKLIATLTIGEPVGALSMFSNDGRRTATVVARRPTSLLVLPRSAIRRLLENDPMIGEQLTLNLARLLAAGVGDFAELQRTAHG